MALLPGGGQGARSSPGPLLTIRQAEPVQELGEAELLKQQACYLPCSDDGLPVIGKVPGLQNAYVATGHSCWGILNAPATGEALAELIAHGSPKSCDLRAFDPARFVAAAARG